MDNNKMRLDPILAISLLLMIKQLFVLCVCHRQEWDVIIKVIIDTTEQTFVGSDGITSELNHEEFHTSSKQVLTKINTTLLLTELEGPPGEDVVERTERSEFRTKTTGANIPQYGSSKLG